MSATQSPSSPVDAADRLVGRTAVLVFLAFALGYFASAVLRTVIATLSRV